MSDVEYYKKRGLATIVISIFSFLVVAIMVVFLFLPSIDMVDGGNEIKMTGLDVLKYGLVKLLPSLKLDKFDVFNTYFTGFTSDNQLLNYVAQYRNYIVLAISGLFVIAFVFAAFEAISGLVWLIAGKQNHPKTSHTLAWCIFIFYALAVSCLFFFTFFYQEIIKKQGADAIVNMHWLMWAALGAIFVGMLLISIVWRIAFRYKESSDTKPEEAPVEAPSQANQ